MVGEIATTTRMHVTEASTVLQVPPVWLPQRDRKAYLGFVHDLDVVCLMS